MLPDMKLLQDLVIIAANEILLPHFRHARGQDKADGSIVTEADILMQQQLQQVLAKHWPEYRFLSEEMSIDDQQQILNQHDQGVWCIDPLDGTSNFAAGIPFFAVSVALIVAGKPQLGIVYDPIRQECFSAIAGAGAFLNGECLTMKTSPDSLKRAIGLIDFKRLDKGLATRLISQPPYASQRSFGSVALDWCWLAAGRCHVYLHGKQNIWDYAAGCLVLAEAGGQALSLEGTPVFQCSLTPRSVMAALDSRMFAEWRQWLLVTRADS